jgi:hypothetical protein
MVTGTTTMYRVQQVATGVAGSPYYFTGYFDSFGGTAQAAATAWRTCLGDTATIFTTPYSYSAIDHVDQVDPVTGNTVAVLPVTVAALAFTAVTDPLPPAASLLIRWRSGIYVDGREIRGRTNIARLPETSCTAGLVDPASLTAWQGRATALVNDTNSKHVIYSKKQHLWAETTVASVWNQFAVLTSRRD